MDFYVQDFGAVGDGKTLNTVAIQNTIEACFSKGGGRVIICDGTFLTGTIILKSNVNLHIEESGVILGSQNCGRYDENSRFDVRPYPYNVILSGDIVSYGDYPDFPKKHVNTQNLPRNRGCCLIYAEESENISITGKGKIDANGTAFTELAPKEAHHYTKYRRIHAPTPPRVTFFAGCKNVSVEDITLTNGPAGWSFWIHDCDDVSFDSITIDCDLDYPNNDGIHVNCSRNVTVKNCKISCSDDCIVVRANSRSLKENKTCENVSVSNCVLTSPTSAIRIAFVCDGVIRNCEFSNLSMIDCNVGVLLEIPDKHLIQSDYGRESTLVENLRFSEIVMDNVLLAVKINLFDGEDTTISRIRMLDFEKITAKCKDVILINGTPSVPIEDVRFTSCIIHSNSHDPIKITNAKNITFDGVDLSVL
ncbi:MAG: right-handed parallel beta-helix repeat-containing protein [Clostridia bacterium]|nr:right-handed parallel beta-helix repeat-containing protein [Clostridia bacterium]